MELKEVGTIRVISSEKVKQNLKMHTVYKQLISKKQLAKQIGVGYYKHEYEY